MIQLGNIISGAENLSKIETSVKKWNFEKLNGIGFYRKHDKYSIIELNIYEFENYPNNENIDKLPYSYLDWKVPENKFEISNFESGKDEMVKFAEFFINWISSIKGERLYLIFEINFAGFHPTDSWNRGACSNAFLNAIISCFDEELYNIGLEKKNTNHLQNGIYQSVYIAK
ncbi:hypothetical protein GKZ90_0017700 [Flavobacterium sp. MC2016-06]|jgi:hypothetical protein|uniref:hypothetical protein n=1 Tax=Flavobacterium sp. MC2016-06 TaxID=2676308 RepID=UPI0012BAC27E|nr:hypothetical protein [Flavobacterium sp. MC2016-06]MBU3860405.1 hypothetical protein [Flavobacterium sp. MC2016-06]